MTVLSRRTAIAVFLSFACAYFLSALIRAIGLYPPGSEVQRLLIAFRAIAAIGSPPTTKTRISRPGLSMCSWR